MESIHALINQFSRVYASLNGKRQTHSILKSLAAVNEQLMSHQKEAKAKEENSSQSSGKKRWWQGMSKTGKETHDFDDQVKLLHQMLRSCYKVGIGKERMDCILHHTSSLKNAFVCTVMWFCKLMLWCLLSSTLCMSYYVTCIPIGRHRIRKVAKNRI